MKTHVTSLAVVLAACAASAHAMLLPAGLSYVAPTGENMTLAFSETYGADNDGQGSWSGGAISVGADYVQLNVAAGSSYTLPVGVANLRNLDKVIDIGIKSYHSDNWPGAWSAVLRLNDAYGSGYRNEWVFRPDPELGSGNVDGATIAGAVNPTGQLKIAEQQVSVLRLTGRATGAAYINDDQVNVATTGGAWNGGANHGLFLWASSPGQSVWQIAWIKVYTNVDPASYGAPLVPEPATVTLLGLASLALIRRRR